jgi:hypothetical protein
MRKLLSAAFTMHPFVISDLGFYFIFFAAPAQRQNAQNYFSVCARRKNLTALKFDIIPPMNNSPAFHPKVAIFASTNLKGGRSTCRGILDYARKNGPWRCMLLEGRDNEQLLDIKRLGFDGIISHAVSRRDAKALADIGCFALVLEKVPASLATRVSQEISIPTIGIGAGNGTDGQILVVADMLGMTQGFSPRFLRRYANLNSVMTDAIGRYVEDVKNSDFPNEKESY